MKKFIVQITGKQEVLAISPDQAVRDVRTWLNSDEICLNYEAVPLDTCDDCDEEHEKLTPDGNPYGKNCYYCDDCLERRSDADPDYDKESAKEEYENALRERQELRRT